MARTTSDHSIWRTAGLRVRAAIAGMLCLTACDTLPEILPPQMPPSLTDTEETTQFVTVPLNRTWVHAPGAVVATERGLLNSREQRIGLVNHTAAPGDNMLILRARVRQGQQLGRFRYAEFLRRIGSLPVPFTNMQPGDLMTGEDELGAYFWAENRSGANTVCVLGLRRLDSGARQMPDDTNVLDVMLRNCVNGTPEQALEPLMATNIGNYPGTSGVRTQGNSRMLSALAGPTPQ